VPVCEVRDALRKHWKRWGLPEILRVDNGVPWGNWNDLPTPFALWIVGVGVRWHWNDPARPQQNPKIERSQGTGKRWSEPRTCQSVAELQRRLDEADLIQRERYPQPSTGKSRLELFPELRHSGRRYTASWEKKNWSLVSIRQHLAEYVAVRKVSTSGHISVYDRGRYVGKQYGGQEVQVQYDPDAQEWLISDAEGRALRHYPAPEINPAELDKMNFRKPRGVSK
jgi:hypothetical protein